MTTKKVFGYVLMVVAIILTFAIIALFPKFIVSFFKIFTGSLDSYQVGKVIGSLIYWVAHFTLTITLWIYGKRWIKNKKLG